jgi:hypothetical protein
MHSLDLRLQDREFTSSRRHGFVGKRGTAEIFTQFLYPLAAAASATYPMSIANSSFFVAPTFEFVSNNGEGWEYWPQD